jgi:hypothetical protein
LHAKEAGLQEITEIEAQTDQQVNAEETIDLKEVAEDRPSTQLDLFDPECRPGRLSLSVKEHSLDAKEFPRQEIAVCWEEKEAVIPDQKQPPRPYPIDSGNSELTLLADHSEVTSRKSSLHKEPVILYLQPMFANYLDLHIDQIRSRNDARRSRIGRGRNRDYPVYYHSHKERLQVSFEVRVQIIPWGRRIWIRPQGSREAIKCRGKISKQLHARIIF